MWYAYEGIAWSVWSFRISNCNVETPFRTAHNFMEPKEYKNNQEKSDEDRDREYEYEDAAYDSETYAVDN